MSPAVPGIRRNGPPQLPPVSVTFNGAIYVETVRAPDGEELRILVLEHPSGGFVMRAPLSLEGAKEVADGLLNGSPPEIPVFGANEMPK